MTVLPCVEILPCFLKIIALDLRWTMSKMKQAMVCMHVRRMDRKKNSFSCGKYPRFIIKKRFSPLVGSIRSTSQDMPSVDFTEENTSNLEKCLMRFQKRMRKRILFAR
ncbi:unnamed protein product [Musa acuminata subsp. burmannicoides]